MLRGSYTDESKTVEFTGKALEVKDLENALDKITANSGYAAPPPLIDPTTYQQYVKLLNRTVIKFTEGDWVFDGSHLYEVINQDYNAVHCTKLTDKEVFIHSLKPEKLLKVPKGSSLPTVKTLFGKK